MTLIFNMVWPKGKLVQKKTCIDVNQIPTNHIHYTSTFFKTYSHWYVSAYSLGFENFNQDGKWDALFTDVDSDASMFRIVCKSNMTRALAEDLEDHMIQVLSLLDQSSGEFHDMRVLRESLLLQHDQEEEEEEEMIKTESYTEEKIGEAEDEPKPAAPSGSMKVGPGHLKTSPSVRFTLVRSESVDSDEERLLELFTEKWNDIKGNPLLQRALSTKTLGSSFSGGAASKQHRRRSSRAVC